MNNKYPHNSLIEIQKLSHNEDYYQLVFKRAERVASAVFYILSHIEDTPKTHIHHTKLSDTAMELHSAIIKSLNIEEYAAASELQPLLHTLVALESTVRLATAARVLSGDLELTLITEIESLERYLKNHYLSGKATLGGGSNTQSLASSTSRPRESVSRPRRQRTQIPAGDLSSDAIMVYSELSDRTARIKTVLEAKPEATIKDLSDIITDVSTKTIQRDLNSLIDKGEVIRHGERRWSKYSIKG